MRASRLLVAAAIVAAPLAGVAPASTAPAADRLLPAPPAAPSSIVCGDYVTRPAYLLVRTPSGGHRLVAAKFERLLTRKERRHAEPCVVVTPVRVQP